MVGANAVSASVSPARSPQHLDRRHARMRDVELTPDLANAEHDRPKRVDLCNGVGIRREFAVAAGRARA